MDPNALKKKNCCKTEQKLNLNLLSVGSDFQQGLVSFLFGSTPPFPKVLRSDWERSDFWPSPPPPLSQLHLYIWMANIQPCNYEWICECVYVYVCEQKTLVILPFHIHLNTCWEKPAAVMQPSFELCERGQLRNTQLYAWGTVHSVHCLPFYQRRIRFTCFPASSLVYVKCIQIVYDKRRGKKLDFHSQ